ncbi:class I SAM-dependent RNA methyltransferase [Sporosarcina sp. Marseille-Q4063]|uniref:THUMP domain-containing class I SAM-dependent RNA methyltransferase n=1 Tax=Sporosarcina sp. Marseille-Q4063 TaxID=2810514 RepID=UPI001BB00477|nr:class I SAM-dependent RNA methyltransferase [Sporosarcina sp. Marseille-Q4063]QUW22147.1 class I SAM-dependent RNA methyltransferase [Sporosarcina sp. Marseille-Q4063]
MNEFKLVATSAMGLESLVADEVKALGYETRTENGKIFFSGDTTAIARANMWLRVADRVRIIAGEFHAKTFDDLFERTKAIPWEMYLPVDAAFPVAGKSVKSTLFSVPDCQAIVKKAIVERLNLAYKRNGFLPESGPLFKLEVSILKDKVTLTIDSSGTGLHRRGYRIGQGDAPIKETLAAALVKLTRWSPERPFIDPLCGSGTLPIEAAMIGQNIAPGTNREFLSEQWPWIEDAVWDRVREEAEDLAKYDQQLAISGSDSDPRMVRIAEENAAEAGFVDLINWEVKDLRDIEIQGINGVMVGNPPYGERIGELEEAEEITRILGDVMKNHPSWSVYMISPLENFESLYGRKATRKRKLFNGFIRTDYYQYWGKRQ